MRLRLLLAACILALPGRAAAQSAPADSARSTRAGVYSREQAAQGSELYALNCVSCHTAATHTGPAFVAKWQGRALAELFAYVRTEMPKNDPGILSDHEYIVLLAYMLKMNGMPPGSGELPSDSLALKKIRIDLKPDPSQDR
jgi:mono/diheme cytochrome c family protein